MSFMYVLYSMEAYGCTSHNVVIPLHLPLDFARMHNHHSVSTHTGTLKCFAAQMLRSDL